MLTVTAGFRASMGTLDSAADHMPTDGPVVIICASFEGKLFGPDFFSY